MKYVLVTGGVVSGLGKGVTASSIGVVLKGCGHRVTSIKIDPYLNVDAGTMSPFEHGEVFVLDDGGEVDLDLGNYERFLDLTLTKDNNLTTGKVYNYVISRERRGDYLGKTVQVVPHITDAIQEWIQRVAQIPVDGSNQPPEICIIELGGTVGDIESMPFIEALRQLQYKAGPQNFALVHVSLIPVLGAGNEQKTKPTQHSVQHLRSYGLNPTMIGCRCCEPLTKNVMKKLALFCQVPLENIINLFDVSNLWQVPLLLSEQNVHTVLSRHLGLQGSGQLDLIKWQNNLADKWDNLNSSVRIALIGKYTDLADAYLSVIKALQHACLDLGYRLDLRWVEASHLEKEKENSEEEKYQTAWMELENCDGVLIPGGFGTRGTEGKILAAGYARSNRKPYLGICLGMQLAVIEFARNVLNMQDCHSEEFNESAQNKVVIFMPEGSKTQKGGTMRLGSRKTNILIPTSKIAHLYDGAKQIDERHRHRYEVNPDMVQKLEEGGMSFVGKDESGERMEIIELCDNPKDHPFFVACQFHPEFKSRPGRPSPLFQGFINASTLQLKTNKIKQAETHKVMENGHPSKMQKIATNGAIPTKYS